jgi:hypothetical protein
MNRMSARETVPELPFELGGVHPRSATTLSAPTPTPLPCTVHLLFAPHLLFAQQRQPHPFPRFRFRLRAHSRLLGACRLRRLRLLRRNATPQTPAG